jgi:hypothetical protein
MRPVLLLTKQVRMNFVRVGIALCLIFGGLGSGYSGADSKTLDCSRSEKENLCKLLTVRLFDRTPVTFPIRDLVGAGADERFLRPVVIVLTRDQGAVTFGSDRKIAEQINQFLENPKQTDLKIQASEGFIPWVLGSLVALAGISLLFEGKPAGTSWDRNGL